MLAEAAAVCYRDFCRSEYEQWKKRDAYSVEIDELRARCRRFGVRPGMPLDRDSLVKTILKIDLEKWRRAFDYSSGKPYGDRELSSVEHVVPQVSLPAGFGQRLIAGDCPKPFRGFFREDGIFDFNRAMRATLNSAVALRGYYDTTRFVAEMRAIAAAGGRTAEKSALDKAARAISRAHCQDLLLREIAFKYRDRALKDEQALSYKVKHDKGGTVYEYFSTPDTLNVGGVTIRFMPNEVTRPAFSTVTERKTLETLLRARELKGKEFDVNQLLAELRIVQATDRNKRLEILPYLTKFADKAERRAPLSYEGKTKEEIFEMEYSCYCKVYSGLTREEFAAVVEVRNQVFHNGLALDTASALALIRKHLLTAVC